MVLLNVFSCHNSITCIFNLCELIDVFNKFLKENSLKNTKFFLLLSNSYNWTWNNRPVPNRKRSTSRLYIVTLLFNLYAEYIMRNAGLEETQAGIKIARKNINNLRYADDTTLTAESEEDLKKPLDESERE